MSFELPPRLKTGDKVAVVATARVVDPSAVKAGIEILQGWDLKVISGNSLYDSDHLFAGTDRQRLKDLQSALDDSEIRAVFCARGGYGTTRILDLISWKGFQRYPKWICGFSDVTALLCHVHKLGYACLHSSMPQLFCNKHAEQDYQSIKQALFNQEITLEAEHCPMNQSGSAAGILVGGNLSLLVNLIGTGSDANTDGKILILEEVDEYLYHLDRMMMQLVRSGKLQNIKGLIVGHLTRMKEGDLKFGTDAAGVIKSHFRQRNIPIGFGFPFGHDSPNMAVPLGVSCTLEVNKEMSRLISKY